MLPANVTGVELKSIRPRQFRKIKIPVAEIIAEIMLVVVWVDKNAVANPAYEQDHHDFLDNRFVSPALEQSDPKRLQNAFHWVNMIFSKIDERCYILFLGRQDIF